MKKHIKKKGETMSNKFKAARKTMSDTFKKDRDFRFAYEANIAMLLYDKGYATKKLRNKIADEILTLIFDS